MTNTSLHICILQVYKFKEEKVIVKSCLVPCFSCFEIVASGTERDFSEQNICYCARKEQRLNQRGCQVLQVLHLSSI